MQLFGKPTKSNKIMEHLKNNKFKNYAEHIAIKGGHSELAKEKYNHFCETDRDIYHRIPVDIISSYLGITQETLIRIRAEK